MNTACKVAVGVAVLAAAWTVYDLATDDGPSEAEQNRTQAIERLTEERDSLSELADSALASAREDSARAARMAARLDSVQEREGERRREAADRAARAGDNLRATLDSIEAAAGDSARVVALADSAREDFEAHLDADSVRVRSFEVELAATDSARAAERQAKIRWREAFHRKSDELVAAESRADSLLASRNYWRDKRQLTGLERFADSYVHAASKAAVEALACNPQTGGVAECAASTAMLLADALTQPDD